VVLSLLAIAVPFVAFAVVAYRIGRRTQGAIDRFSVSVNAQLTTIHTLVNSDMTAARQELLDQTEITLVMLRRVVADAQREGDGASSEDLEAVAKTERRVRAMRGVLADRLAQQRIVEQQQRDAENARDRNVGGDEP
jgi:hypothetical protein